MSWTRLFRGGGGHRCLRFHWAPFGERERIVERRLIGWSASRLGVGTGLVSVIGEDFEQAELDAMQNAGMALKASTGPEGGRAFTGLGGPAWLLNGRDTLETELNVLAVSNPDSSALAKAGST